jgi:hypothetical protein
VSRQLAGWDCVGQRVRAAVSILSRGRDRTKAHGTARMAHHRRLSVRDECGHGLHACHGATAAVGASFPVTIGRADPRSDRSRIVLGVRASMMRVRRTGALWKWLSALAGTVRHAG